MNNVKKLSKKLSYILRHAPEKAGLTLGEGGWVEIADLLSGLSSNNWTIDRAELDHVVATNDKRRFTISDDGLRIRAAQGHSVSIVQDLVAALPPEILYHGTATHFLEIIKAEGLKPMSRQHVHLSADIETATKVGQRHGKPVTLTVSAVKMAEAGIDFYRADNGVWLTDKVGSEYLRFD